MGFSCVLCAKSGKKPSEADNAKKDIEVFEKTFNFRLKTYYENKALDTVKNAKFTKELIKKENLSSHLQIIKNNSNLS